MDFPSLLAASTSAHAFSLSHATDFFWDNPIFARDSWTNLMNGLRILLTMGGALLLILEARALKMGEKIPEKTRRRIAIVLTAVAFGAYFDFFNPNTRYSQYYHRHEFYHYYLGSKFNRELEYTNLYECTAIAEIELGRGAQVRNREIRDLRVNLIKPVRDTYVLSDPGQCKKRFTPARWAAFKKDVDWFYHSAAGSYWQNMQKDHGYNPPPVWTMEGKLFANFGDAGKTFFKELASLDIILHIGIVLMIGWAFGWRVMAIATVFWGCNAPANFYWTGGAFLRQDWLFFLVASVCLARKRKYGMSGAALTWSSLLRVFPMILFVGPLAIMAFELVRKRRLLRSYKRFIGGAVVAGGLLIPTSVIVCGPQSWPDFFKHIITHKNTPLTNQMGLETMIVHTWKGRMRFTRDDNLDDPFQLWKEGREHRIHQHRFLFLGIIGLVFLWTLWALRRTKLLWVAIPLGLPMVASLTNLTCYYYSMFMIAAVLALIRPQLGPVILAVSGASQVLLIRYYWVDDKFTAQAWLFYFFGLLLLYAYSRPFSMARLKAWWRGEPEPKGGPPPPASEAPAN
jgi:hypothetical protein